LISAGAPPQKTLLGAKWGAYSIPHTSKLDLRGILLWEGRGGKRRGRKEWKGREKEERKCRVPPSTFE